MALEELTTQVEKFIDRCTLSGFVQPHPADVSRMKGAGVVLNASVLAEAKDDAQAEPVAAEPAEEVLSQDTYAEVSSQDILSQEIDGSESQKKRRRKHRHHHEENE